MNIDPSCIAFPMRASRLVVFLFVPMLQNKSLVSLIFLSLWRAIAVTPLGPPLLLLLRCTCSFTLAMSKLLN